MQQPGRMPELEQGLKNVASILKYISPKRNQSTGLLRGSRAFASLRCLTSDNKSFAKQPTRCKRPGTNHAHKESQERAWRGMKRMSVPSATSDAGPNWVYSRLMATTMRSGDE